METADWLVSGGSAVAVDGVELVARRMDGAEPVRTRRRLADLADLVEELRDETFGPGPYRVELWVREPDRVTFRCIVPAERGGGTLDRAWWLRDGTLVAVSLPADPPPDKEVALGLLDRADGVIRSAVADA